MLIARIYDAACSSLAYLRRRQIVTPPAGRVHVNLGSGLVTAPGWINIDVGLPALAAHWPRALQRIAYRMLPSTSAAKHNLTEGEFVDALRGRTFVHHRIEYGLPFHDQSVDAIYSSHLHEHLFRSDAQQLLREAHRVLRPGAIIRMCVPDLQYALDLFNRGDKETALSFFFYDRGPSEYTRHRYMYDFDLLAADLGSAGFTQICRRSFREGAVPDLDVLDNRPDQTLFVEAIRS